MAQAATGKRVLLVHATGNANVRQAALALHRSGMLAAFHTTIAWNRGGLLDRLLPGGLRSEMARRSYPDLPVSLIHPHCRREPLRLLATRMGWSTFTRHESGPFSFDAVAWELEREVAAELESGAKLDAVYAYDTCARDIFEAAKQRGIRCIFDQPTGYYRASLRIIAEERELKPEWASTLSGILDSPKKLARKDREIELADAIVVASSFTERTMKEYPQPITAPIFKIPYGAPPVGDPRQPTRREDVLRVLYVGQMGARKGLAYLLEAMDRLEVPATLTLLGRPIAVPPVLKRALQRHHWIDSAPHTEVLRLMREHDVLVFPSLFDGFGLVILEAMAQGTPVITTPNTAAPDLLADGRDGFIVPIRSADAIAARLAQLADDRDLLAKMSEAARQKAAECSWEEFRRRLVAAVTESIS